MRALFAEGESANTSRSYTSALKYWGCVVSAPLSIGVEPAHASPGGGPIHCRSHRAHNIAKDSLKHQLPAALDRQLVQGRFKGSAGALALNTVLHRISVMSKAHQFKDLPKSRARSGGSRTPAPGPSRVCRPGCTGRPQDRTHQRSARRDARHLYRWAHRGTRSRPAPLCVLKRRSPPLRGERRSDGKSAASQ